MVMERGLLRVEGEGDYGQLEALELILQAPSELVVWVWVLPLSQIPLASHMLPLVFMLSFRIMLF